MRRGERADRRSLRYFFPAARAFSVTYFNFDEDLQAAHRSIFTLTPRP